MKTHGHAIGGGDSIIRASHITPRNMRRELIQLAGRSPLRPADRLHGPDAREDRASLSSRAALKISQCADTVFNVAFGLLIAAFVILLFSSPFVALGCLLFF